MPLAEATSTLLPTRPRTAFERNLLPGFARWFVEWVQDERPHYLIPAETKGARLLERVMIYARDTLGTPIRVPVLYATALAYMDRERLRRSRVLIVDDTVRTGYSLARHRERIERYGAENISAVACIAHGAQLADGRPAECFRLIDDIELYREYVWQLTELVVARGLPPEVDHHELTLRLPERLPLAWPRLREALADYGRLAIDDAEGEEEGFASMTLHFPQLPGTLRHPTEGPVRVEGVSKIRFFPDPVTEEIHVVPVSFPALDLPDADATILTRECAGELIRGWAQHERSIGELLVDNAKTRDGEMVFRALSTVTEADLMCGLARVLGTVFPAAQTTLLTQREPFHRLYGEWTGERVAHRFDLDICAALGDGQADPLQRRAERDRTPLTLDTEVVESTIRIAKLLKERYEQNACEPDHLPTHTVGESLSEIADSLELGELLVSRCLDYGLAMTTLVPYVQIEAVEGGGTRVRREYRVSELARDPTKSYEDLNDVYQWISEEIVAFVAHHLRTRSVHYGSRPIPTRLLAWMTAILRPLTLSRQGVALGIMPAGEEPLIVLRDVLRDGDRRVTLLDVTSELFALVDGGVEPTPRFEELSAESKLRIDRRGESIEIEDYLALLVTVIDEQLDEDALDGLLAAWAISTDKKLGLAHVGHDLEAALRCLERPLRLCLRGVAHERSPADRERAHALVDAACTKLELLRVDWAATVRAGWPNPTRRVRALLESLAAPHDRSAVYELPAALAELVRCASRIVESLDDASAALWADEAHAEGSRDACVRVLLDCARLRKALISMENEDATVAAPVDAREAVVLAAEELLDLLALVRSFVAATAASYRGARGARVADTRDTQRIAAVLFVDLSRSLEYALDHDFPANHEWKNSGLNLIAQWGRAFGGREMKDREGDAIWLEFEETGDAAVLCAAAVQEHARALRSTGVPWLWWGFHVAVDEGRLEDGDGGNVIGACLDTAARLSKGRKQRDAIEDALATSDAYDRCSPSLREPDCMPSLGEEVVLVEAEGSPVAGATIVPRVVKPAAVMRMFSERLLTAGQSIARGPSAGALERPLIDDILAGDPQGVPEDPVRRTASGDASA